MTEIVPEIREAIAKRNNTICHAKFLNLCLIDPKATSGVECGSNEHIYIIRITF